MALVGRPADMCAPGPPERVRTGYVPASRKLYVPEAQGGVPPGPLVLYVLGAGVPVGTGHACQPRVYRGTASRGAITPVYLPRPVVITPGWTRQLVERSFGASFESLFAHFDETPFASGSIGQVPHPKPHPHPHPNPNPDPDPYPHPLPHPHPCP